ncbi:MAG: hypothetical protein ACRBN8_36415 [Nannocystales bacterium]
MRNGLVILGRAGDLPPGKLVKLYAQRDGPGKLDPEEGSRHDPNDEHAPRDPTTNPDFPTDRP